MVDEPYFYPRIGRDYVECTRWRKSALQRIASIKPDLVMLGTVQTADFSQAQWVEGTARILRVLSPVSDRIYVIRGTPHLPFDGPDCLAARSWLPWLPTHRRGCQATASDGHSSDVYHWLQTAAAGFDNVKTIDMNPLICPEGECRAEREGRVVFRDSQHLTASFVRSLAPALEKRMELQPSAQLHPSTSAR